MKKTYDAKKFLEKVNQSIEDYELELEFPDVFYDALLKGKQERKQRQHFEYKKFDKSWLSNIESFFPSIDKITRNLKSNLKYEQEILPIEKTKKTNPESIRHLTRNTRFIREVNEENEIIPEKVLNTLSEVEYGIYENRFIMTLIVKLRDYLYNRLKVIRTEMHGFKETTFHLTNDFELNHAEYDLEFKLKAKEVMVHNQDDDDNVRVLERTERLYQLVSRLMSSEFMQIMKRYKPVKPPILKTQIIMKNPDFRNAYMLWLYLDKTHVLEYELEVETKQKRFNQQYYTQLNQGLLVLFSTIFNHSDLGSEETDDIVQTMVKKPKDVLDYGNNIDTKLPLFDIEPQDASEFYLQKAKKLLNRQYQESVNATGNKLQSLKQLLTEQYQIIDQVYQDFFEVNQDDDVFSRLIIFEDPIKAFDDAIQKYDIARTVRQLKEDLYDQAMSLEQKWTLEILEKQEAALKYLEEQGMEATNKQVQEIQKAISKDQVQYERKLATERKQALAKKKAHTQTGIRGLKLKYETELKKFKEKERSRLTKEKERLKLQLKKEKEKLKLKQQKERARDAAALAKKREETLKKYKAQIEKEKKEYSVGVDKKLGKTTNTPSAVVRKPRSKTTSSGKTPAPAKKRIPVIKVSSSKKIDLKEE